MELLHKENTLIDFMCVGAMFPTLSRERPISSRHLVMASTGTIKDYIIDGQLRLPTTAVSFQLFERVLWRDLRERTSIK